MYKHLKILLASVLASVSLPIVAIPAEALIDTLRITQYDWTCVKVVNGVDQLISGHTRQDKAITACQMKKLNDLEGQYEVVPGRYRIILTPEAAAQISLPLTTCPDGTMNTAYPGGNCPSGGSCSTWTATAIGTNTTIDCNYIDANTITVTTSGVSDYSGIGFVNKVEASDIDMQMDVQIPDPANWSGTIENFTGCGVMFRDALGVNDYNFYAWRPSGGAVAHKAVENQTLITSGAGTAGTPWPRYARIWYDDSATTLKAFESNNGTDWDQVGADVIKSLSFPVNYGVFCTSHNEAASVTVPLDLIAYTNTLDTGGGGVVLPTEREVAWEATFEGGMLNPRGSGTLDASLALTASEFSGTNLGISDISETDPAIITYTGTDPANGTPYQVSGVSNMTQINGQLVYVAEVNTTNNTFEAAVANDPEWAGNGTINITAMWGNQPTDDPPGTGLRMDATGYTPYGGGGTLLGFNPAIVNYVNGGFGPETSFKNKVIINEGNTVGTLDTNVKCRTGNYCFRSHIGYHHANESNSKNKPRMTMRPADDAKWDYDQKTFLGWSIYVPLSACEDTGNGQQGNQIIGFSGNSASQDQFHIYMHRPAIGGQTYWTAEVSTSTDPAGGQDFPTSPTLLFPITKGKWHDFVVELVTDPVTGYFKLWHNEAVGQTIGDTAELVFEKTGGYGNIQYQSEPIHMTFRQYNFTWKHQPTTCQQDDQWLVFDDVRIGQASIGATFAEVHPSGQSQP